MTGIISINSIYWSLLLVKKESEIVFNQLVLIVAFYNFNVSPPPPPPSYLLNFLLDSIIGLPIIFALLKAVALLVKKFDLTVLRSGEYGK